MERGGEHAPVIIVLFQPNAVVPNQSLPLSPGCPRYNPKRRDENREPGGGGHGDKADGGRRDNNRGHVGSDCISRERG